MPLVREYPALSFTVHRRATSILWSVLCVTGSRKCGLPNVPVSAALIREKAEMIASRLVAEYQNANADDKQNCTSILFRTLRQALVGIASSWIVSIWCLESSRVSIRDLTSHCLLIVFIHNTLFFFFEF